MNDVVVDVNVCVMLGPAGQHIRGKFVIRDGAAATYG